MMDVLSLTLPLFGLIALGYGATFASRQPMEALGWLNFFIIYVSLPALFYKLLASTPIDQLTRFDYIGVVVGVSASILIVGTTLGLLTSGGRLSEASIQGLASAYGNIGYMGPALTILALGEPAAIPVALIFCFENIMYFAFAPAVMALSGRSSGGALKTILSVLKSILLHPFILATMVGVGAAAAEFSAPTPLQRLIDTLAQAAAPCALFAMGVTLGLRPLKRVPPSLGFILPLKLVIHPIAMYLALSFFGPFDPIWVFSAVLLASLPSATNVYVIAQQYGVWVERASAAVLASTALSALTVSALLYAVATGLLPADASELFGG